MNAHSPLTASTLRRCADCDAELFTNETMFCAECQLDAALCGFCQAAPVADNDCDVDTGLCEDCFATLELELDIETAWQEHEAEVFADGWRAAIRDLYLPVTEPVVLRKLA